MNWLPGASISDFAVPGDAPGTEIGPFTRASAGYVVAGNSRVIRIRL